MVRKVDALAAEEKQNALFDKRLAEEEVWIRQGIKARRTRNEGRVRALEQMRRVRSQRQAPTSKVQLEIQEGQRSGMLVAAADAVGFAYGEKQSFAISPPTSCAATKLASSGPTAREKPRCCVSCSANCHRSRARCDWEPICKLPISISCGSSLHEERSVQDNVGDGYESVEINGRPRHIIGYLQDFLFSPERARTPVRFLSGGERNRVLLAKLFAKPANVIVLDEPTNDLDAETLELLEERLVQFDGTVLLVSHDRTFLNNVVTSTIVFEEGDGARVRRRLRRLAPTVRGSNRRFAGGEIIKQYEILSPVCEARFA